MSVKIGSFDPNFMLGSNQVQKIYLGAYLVWSKSGTGSGGGGDSGGGTGGDTTHELDILSVSAGDIPASGGSVSTCTVTYMLDGVVKNTSKSFSAVSSGNLGTSTTLRTLKGERNISVTDGGITKSTTVYVYQEENKMEKIEILSRGEWTLSGGGSVSVDGEEVIVQARQTCTAKETYTSTTTIVNDDYQDAISVSWTVDGTICTGISGTNGSYIATISSNQNPTRRNGWARATYNGSTKTVSFSQEARQKEAIEYLVVTATQVPNSPSGICSVTIENTSDRSIKFSYNMGNTSADVETRTATVEGGNTWGGGGYWEGIVSASFA